jgi:hypothetical protein
MLPVLGDSERLSERIERAVDTTVESRNADWIGQEPHFTDRMLARVEDAVNQFEGSAARWRARTLGDRGPRSEESRYGADFLGVFEVTTSGLSFAKGFLAQAKILELGHALAPTEHNRLRQQCRRMLDVTPDSFVFLYGGSGVRIVSGLAVLGSDQRSLHELGSKSPGEFFHDHFHCFIGDGNLTAPADLPRLALLAPLIPRPYGVRRGLVIEAIGQI